MVTRSYRRGDVETVCQCRVFGWLDHCDAGWMRIRARVIGRRADCELGGSCGGQPERLGDCR